MVKEQLSYSCICSAVNSIPIPIVKVNPSLVSSQFELSNDIWAQVIVAPLERSTVVLRRGTPNGLIGWTQVGGHEDPISAFGQREEWKKAQKKDMKKQISLMMNSIIPTRTPFSTLFVCFPWYVASRLISRHHKTMVIKIIISPTVASLPSCLFIQPAAPASKYSVPAAPVKGHGLGSTRWKGCFILLRHKELFLKLFHCWKHDVRRFTFHSIKSWALCAVCLIDPAHTTNDDRHHLDLSFQSGVSHISTHVSKKKQYWKGDYKPPVAQSEDL